MKRIEEIFDVLSGNSLELLNCEEVAGGIPFVSRTSSNNGIAAYVKSPDAVEPMSAPAISVALSGSVLSAFYQSRPFYTAFHVACLYPKVGLTAEEMLFYCVAIEKNKYRYNYGRQANKTLKSLCIPAPQEIPQYVCKHSVDSPFTKEPMVDKRIELHTERWKWFRYDEIFEITTSTDKNLQNCTANGQIPYISSSQLNNGISSFVDEPPAQLPNTLTVARNGSVGSVFYQPIAYCASPDDVRIFTPKFRMNRYVGIFLTVLIEQEKYRFAYGRKFGTKRMKDMLIKLPVTPNGEPDWQFMETYIKSLPYSGNL